MSRRASLATLVALSLIGAPAAAASVPPALLAAARLQGYWTASGVVTKSVNVPDERPGTPVTRTWAFVPSCPTGACSTLMLVRQRGPGYDSVVLQSTGPGVYAGTGSFYAPVQCRGKVFRKGELVPYTIHVTITGVAQQPDGSVLATTFAATYRNPRRIGLTRCYSAPSYDSADYTAAPAAAPPATGAIRKERRTPSSTGS
ncbi:MAG: hypothetical protein WCB67_04630 [Solirubrobacteraceae bacterium]